MHRALFTLVSRKFHSLFGSVSNISSRENAQSCYRYSEIRNDRNVIFCRLEVEEVVVRSYYVASSLKAESIDSEILFVVKTSVNCINLRLSQKGV